MFLDAEEGMILIIEYNKAHRLQTVMRFKEKY